MNSLTEQANAKEKTHNGQMDDLMDEAEEKKRLQCWLPEPLHRRLKLTAAEQGTTMTEITEEALRRLLDGGG